MPGPFADHPNDELRPFLELVDEEQLAHDVDSEQVRALGVDRHDLVIDPDQEVRTERPRVAMIKERDGEPAGRGITAPDAPGVLSSASAKGRSSEGLRSL